MENASQAPSCSVSGSQRRNAQANADADSANQQLQDPQQQPEHDIFGDWNLNIFMMFMLLLHFMQYAMRQPCGC